MQVVAQGAPSNAELLEVWQRVALPAAAGASGGPSRRGSRLSRLFSRRGSGRRATPAPGPSGRLAHWLSSSGAGRSLSWLLRLPAAPGSAAEGEQEQQERQAAEEEEEEEGRLVMEVAGDEVDLGGLTLVLSAANQAAGGQLSPPEVRAAAQAVIQR